MSRLKKDPLRESTDAERQELLQVGRAQAAPAAEVARAKALTPRHGGGRPPTYDASARERILREARRTPTPEADGTASWSLNTLREALRSAPDGLAAVSTYTIQRVLHEAGYSRQRTRAWCPTGSALRLRKAGPVVVSDPDAEPKKS